MLLDRFMPEYDVHERHSIAVDAPAADVMRAARSLRSRNLPLTTALMAVRSVPELVLHRRLPLSLGGPVVDSMLSSGFVLLADEPDELVLGAVGRFWSTDGGFVRVARGEFEEFDEPGYVKAAMNLHAEGAALSTETRIRATDEGARRSFGRYWRVISPGSAVIRLEWLHAARRLSRARARA
jgi:hypothetical protein